MVKPASRNQWPGQPLLFTGEDFVHMYVAPALRPPSG
jgi:hypothetical protein